MHTTTSFVMAECAMIADRVAPALDAIGRPRTALRIVPLGPVAMEMQRGPRTTHGHLLVLCIRKTNVNCSREDDSHKCSGHCDCDKI